MSLPVQSEKTTVLVLGYINGNEEYTAWFNLLYAELAKVQVRLVWGNIGPAPEGESFNVPLEEFAPSKLPRWWGRGRFMRAHADAITLEACYEQRRGKDVVPRLWAIEHYVDRLLEAHQPAVVLLGHQWTGIYMVAEAVCQKRSVPFLYYHPGVLPGTFCLEEEGQMAESWVCRETERFQALPVQPEQLQQANQYIEGARTVRYVRPRHRQPDGGLEPAHIDALKAEGKKVIFYAGVNDLRTGIWPRELPGSDWHSPYAESSLQGLQELSQAVGETAHILYKPHPSTSMGANELVAYENVSLLTSANVFDLFTFCDLCVTILSSVSYEALIHGCPVLQMGRNQLTGKACCYEALTAEALPGVVSHALQIGYTDTQRTHFEAHVARLLNHYLFAMDPKLMAGPWRGVEAVVEYILERVLQQQAA